MDATGSLFPHSIVKLHLRSAAVWFFIAAIAAAGVAGQGYQPHAEYSIDPSNVVLSDAGEAGTLYVYSSQASGQPLFIGVAAFPPKDPWRLMCQQVDVPYAGNLNVLPRFTHDTAAMPDKTQFDGGPIVAHQPVILAEGPGFNYPDPPAPPPPLEFNQFQIVARADRMNPAAPYIGTLALWFEVGEGTPQRYDLPPIQFSFQQRDFFSVAINGVMSFGSVVNGKLVSQQSPEIVLMTNRHVVISAEMSQLSKGGDAISGGNLSLAIGASQNDAEHRVQHYRSFGQTADSAPVAGVGTFYYYLAAKASVPKGLSAGAYSGVLNVNCTPM